MIHHLIMPKLRAGFLANPPQWFMQAVGVERSAAGINISTDRALMYAAVYCAIRIISESVGSLPCKVYRQTADGADRVVDRLHPLWKVLHDRPHPNLAASAFFESMTSHLNTNGNAYSEIVKVRDGTVRLSPINPVYVMPKLASDASLTYEVHDNSEKGRRVLNPDSLLHVRGLSGDGILGWSPIRAAREAIGLGMAAERHGATFFGNGSRPSGVLITPGTMDEPTETALRAAWESMYGGQNSNKTAILKDGLDFKPISIPNEDAQFLETRKFQVLEIARIWRIPPHMLADRDASTRASVEQEALEFVTHTLRPWLIRWEQELNYKLFRNDPEHYCEFVIDALLRADILTRARVYQLMIQSRVMNPNEARERENMSPYEGGDSFENPNTSSGRNDDFSSDDEEKGEDTKQAARVCAGRNGFDAIRPEAVTLCDMAYRRTLNKESKALQSLVKKANGDRTRLNELVRAWYMEYTQEARDNLLPPLRLMRILDGDIPSVAETSADREIMEYLSSNRAQVLATARHSDGDFTNAVTQLIESWNKD